ncbi:MAG: hypothetical protein GXX85_17355 [Ignavibacteria bacterium]|nr:hypothetical protein [Ignavibacteria bacterium]
MTTISLNQCNRCIHFIYKKDQTSGYKCKAFPQGIPDELLAAELYASAEWNKEIFKETGVKPFLHNKKHPDQVGDYLFEPFKTQS